MQPPTHEEPRPTNSTDQQRLHTASESELCTPADASGRRSVHVPWGLAPATCGWVGRLPVVPADGAKLRRRPATNQQPPAPTSTPPAPTGHDQPRTSSTSTHRAQLKRHRPHRTDSEQPRPTPYSKHHHAAATNTDLQPCYLGRHTLEAKYPAPTSGILGCIAPQQNTRALLSLRGGGTLGAGGSDI